MIAGTPNRIRTALFALLPTSISLKILLKKWTTPVNAIASSIGKNKAKTGINMVPNPKPEKKVRMEVKNATRQIIK